MNENQKLVAGFVQRGQISFDKPLSEEEAERIYNREKKREEGSDRKPRRVCPFPDIAHLKGNAYKKAYAAKRREVFKKQGLTTSGQPRVRK